MWEVFALVLLKDEQKIYGMTCVINMDKQRLAVNVRWF